MIQKSAFACINLVLSATDQAKAVRELTQHETTSAVSEQDVGETTRRRNDRKPFSPRDLELFLPFLKHFMPCNVQHCLQETRTAKMKDEDEILILFHLLAKYLSF